MASLFSVVAALTLASATLPALSQVQCRMPNGVVITQQLGGCPRDAVQISPGGDVVPAPAANSPGKQQAAAAVASQKPAVVTAPSSGGDGFPMLAWVLIVGLGAGLVFAIKGSGGVSGPPQFCTTCGHEGPAKTKTRGSTAVELVLWLCIFVPGLIYSVWRLASKFKACTQCGGTALVPPTSPIAIATKKKLVE